MNNRILFRYCVLILFALLSLRSFAQGSSPVISSTPIPTTFIGLSLGMDQTSAIKTILGKTGYRMTSVEGGMDVSADNGSIYFQGLPFGLLRLLFTGSDKLATALFISYGTKAEMLAKYDKVKSKLSQTYEFETEQSDDFEKLSCFDKNMTLMSISITKAENGLYALSLQLFNVILGL